MNAVAKFPTDSTASPRPQSDPAVSLDQSISQTIATFASLKQIEPAIAAASELILSTLHAGHKLLIGGNGGSAAEASHFSTELTGRYNRNRRALPAMPIGADASLVTCIGNDYGFDAVFARPIEAFALPGDLVVLISSSGNSPNVLAGIEAAQRSEANTLTLLGRGGGAAHAKATVEVTVPGLSGRTAQEAHLFLIHHFCDQIDLEFS